MSNEEIDNVDAQFSAAVRRRREARGLSQSELARRMQQAGLPDATQVLVSRIESGKRSIRLAEARAVARALDVPLEELADPAGIGARLTGLRLELGSATVRQRELHDAARAYEANRSLLWGEIGALARRLHVSDISDSERATMAEHMARAQMLAPVSAVDVVAPVVAEWEKRNGKRKAAP